MRHNVAGKKLNRDIKQRKALFKNLITALIEHGEIKTTEAKAKAIRGIADKLIHKAKEGTVAARRVLASFFGTRQVVNKLVDEVAPVMKDRDSGFTRIVRMSDTRRGDNATVVRMELVAKPEAGKKVEAKSEAAEVKAEVPAKAEPKAKKTAKAGK